MAAITSDRLHSASIAAATKPDENQYLHETSKCSGADMSSDTDTGWKERRATIIRSTHRSWAGVSQRLKTPQIECSAKQLGRM
jgi:hypothetical protein